MTELIVALVEFLKQFSYFGIMLSLCFEFIPAEVVLPLAGYWVYQGDFNYYLVVLVGAVGGTLGPLTLFYLGRYGGRPLVLKYGKYFFVSQKQINASDYFFEKYGMGVAFFARFLPVVRTAISIPCGMSNMNVWKFSVYTFFAMLPITAFYVYLGVKLGPHWNQAEEIFNGYALPFTATLIVLLLMFVLIKLLMKRKSQSL
ncbi:DedA family protein [Paenibacillus alkaliterrae]|uniref:DedA family protein n=1 Tax=Paenibacillus alkaliterrae TaxID=320909 RepID=UPI001F26C482|nr:DedA family protein [Paenibacillus alkaliterrae]MCF2940096.1 DedA family protein [Paenibacillus alkaliterrae]